MKISSMIQRGEGLSDAEVAALKNKGLKEERLESAIWGGLIGMGAGGIVGAIGAAIVPVLVDAMVPGVGQAVGQAAAGAGSDVGAAIAAGAARPEWVAPLQLTLFGVSTVGGAAIGADVAHERCESEQLEEIRKQLAAKAPPAPAAPAPAAPAPAAPAPAAPAPAAPAPMPVQLVMPSAAEIAAMLTSIQAAMAPVAP